MTLGSNATFERSTLKMYVSRARPVARYADRTFRHFQSATARTNFVLGEFPWRVEVEDKVEVADFVAPPFMLSREGTANEATWSLGEYTSGDEIWKAFALPGEPPEPVGVFAHQPSPYRARTGSYLRTFAALAALLLLLLAGRSLTATRINTMRYQSWVIRIRGVLQEVVIAQVRHGRRRLSKIRHPKPEKFTVACMEPRSRARF